MSSLLFRKKTILVTGGTSGLGLELVRILLKQGHNVVVTGRTMVNFEEHLDHFTFYGTDFCNLANLSSTVHEMCRRYSFDCIVNNAGILSPPVYTKTDDGLEYTFQVNFMAHLLINEIILRSVKRCHPLLIVGVTSPVYRIADLNFTFYQDPSKYKPIKVYAASKLNIAIMGQYLASAHGEMEVKNFSFDPGTFRSKIYRMQREWFHFMYRIASPVLRDPVKVAEVLAKHMANDSISYGMIYGRSKEPKKMPVVKRKILDDFMRECYAYLDKFLT